MVLHFLFGPTDHLTSIFPATNFISKTLPGLHGFPYWSIEEMNDFFFFANLIIKKVQLYKVGRQPLCYTIYLRHNMINGGQYA